MTHSLSSLEELNENKVERNNKRQQIVSVASLFVSFYLILVRTDEQASEWMLIKKKKMKTRAKKRKKG